MDILYFPLLINSSSSTLPSALKGYMSTSIRRPYPWANGDPHREIKTKEEKKLEWVPGASLAGHVGLAIALNWNLPLST